ncbi:head-tail adaptor protein [Phyllobacterium phragmitis]|uniref:Head-tail adaptor protein n=1 Tax=Phyllobacterium phragmitis TaxID=2670329 RepID=A0A2S9INT7_9HYPH|nr:phage head closure protein [Phyllobacterium phragmitis]PRD42175.1 head-tail adaptor protein [Phyllobacterium phragmitis]
MTKQISAGDLYYRVALDKRENANDGAGNTIGKFVEQFQCRAAYRHLRGGESVMASRLTGKHLQVVIVRETSLTRQITAGWQLRDVHAGKSFNVRDVTQEVDRAFISLLCESGVATG